MLNAMCGNTASSSVISERVNEWQLYNVYAVPVMCRNGQAEYFLRTVPA